MSIQRFKYLCVQYINKSASPDEIREFLAMVQSAEYDREMQVILDELWVTSEREAILDEETAEDIFNAIISSTKKLKTVTSWYHKTVWLRTVAALLILGVAAVLYFAKPVAKTNTYAQRQELKPAKSEIPTRRFINLPDGSSVILNENSIVELGKRFGANGKREVYLRGEAYFDIIHDPERPFIVHAGKIETTVLGTAFSINSNLEDHKLSVTVIRGRVKVGDTKQVFGILDPDQQLVLDKNIGKYIQKSVDADAETAWKNEDIYFDEVTLQDVATELSRRFNVPIMFSNESIKKCRFSATFLKGQNLEQILNVIAEFNQIKFQLKDNAVTLEGAGCQ